jgi:hypothetical protein
MYSYNQLQISCQIYINCLIYFRMRWLLFKTKEYDKLMKLNGIMYEVFNFFKKNKWINRIIKIIFSIKVM